ncbi:MAG: hypothetical protein WBD07_02375 [Vicinamibacterales bacterium]
MDTRSWGTSAAGIRRAGVAPSSDGHVAMSVDVSGGDISLDW